MLEPSPKREPLEPQPLDGAALERLVGRIHAGTERATRRKAAWRRARLALPLVTIVALSGALWQGSRASSQWVGDVVETRAEPLSLTLPDGSTVRLARDSRLELIAQASDRVALALRKGQAAFDVEDLPERRFVLSTPSIDVHVVGTRFSVRVSGAASGSSTEVTVERGVVEVTEAGSTRVLGRLTAGSTWTHHAEPAMPRPSATPEGHDSEATSASDAAPATSNRASVAGLFEAASRARARGDITAALKGYERVATAGSGATSGLAALEAGRIHLHRGAPAAAVPWLKQASRSAPERGLRADAAARLVEAYAALASWADCGAARDQYLARYPGGIHTAEVQQRCRLR